ARSRRPAASPWHERQPSGSGRDGRSRTPKRTRWTALPALASASRGAGLAELVRSSFESLLANRVRSLLTMSGDTSETTAAATTSRSAGRADALVGLREVAVVLAVLVNSTRLRRSGRSIPNTE